VFPCLSVSVGLSKHRVMMTMIIMMILKNIMVMAMEFMMMTVSVGAQ